MLPGFCLVSISTNDTPVGVSKKHSEPLVNGFQHLTSWFSLLNGPARLALSVPVSGRATYVRGQENNRRIQRPSY
jgi:hypothetical protein